MQNKNIKMDSVNKKVEELAKKHRQFLNSIVDNLPIGYLQRSMLLEVDGIIASSPSAPIFSYSFSFGGDIEESTEWWKEVREEIKNYESTN